MLTILKCIKLSVCEFNLIDQTKLPTDCIGENEKQDLVTVMHVRWQEDLVSSLCSHIDSASEATDAYVVCLSGTAMSQEGSTQVGINQNNISYYFLPQTVVRDGRDRHTLLN